MEPKDSILFNSKGNVLIKTKRSAIATKKSDERMQ